MAVTSGGGRSTASRPTSSPLAVLASLLLAAACAGCDSTGPGPDQATQIAAASGNDQRGAAGAALSSAIAVRVTNARGTGVSGVTVGFAVVSGGGSISPSSASTDASGSAAATWTLGTTPGANTATATATGLAGSPVTFTATAVAAAAARLQMVSGDAQSALFGSAVTDSLVVKVSDSFGNAVAGATVTWAVTAGGGSVSPTTATTGSDGLAKTRWTLGNATTNTATASVSGLSAVSFSATGLNPAWPVFHGNPRHTGQSAVNGPQAATLRWRYTTAGITAGTGFNSMVVDRGGTIYVNAGNKLHAIRSDGQVLWTAGITGTGATALSPDEATVYSAGGATLYAFDAATGQQRWTYALSDPMLPIYGEPNVASDGTIYFGSWDKYVYALNPSGTLRWRYQTDGSIAPLASPALSADEQTIYVGTGDPNRFTGGSLLAIRATGSLAWQVRLDNARVSGVVVGPDGTVYATGQGRVYARRPDGSALWESANNTAGSLTPSLSSGGAIITGTSADGKIYGLDASTGQTRWSYQTGQNPNYDPNNPHQPQYGVLATPVIGRDGVAYVGAIDGVMYAFRSDGSLLWSYLTGNSINEHCPAIGPDGTLYFGSADGYLYALKSP